jgi:uncharacterized protein YdeI (YjbR/CyaY-like superfamily)
VSKPTFFSRPAEFRKWLQKHHAAAGELLVGFHKTSSGTPSITWPESVDEALCFGWIDGVRTRIDDVSYTIRFSPRKPTSIWSAVNIRKAQALIAAKRMMPAGHKAFETRRENRSGVYSYEKRPECLTEPYAGMLAKNARAAAFFASMTPSYQRAATWWVISAKQEETRLKRARTLIELCAKAQQLPHLAKWKPKPRKK